MCEPPGGRAALAGEMLFNLIDQAGSGHSIYLVSPVGVGKGELLSLFPGFSCRFLPAIRGEEAGRQLGPQPSGCSVSDPWPQVTWYHTAAVVPVLGWLGDSGPVSA